MKMMQKLLRVVGLIAATGVLIQTNLLTQTIDESAALVQQKKYAEAKTVTDTSVRLPNAAMKQ
jgi:hypothetical protein